MVVLLWVYNYNMNILL